MPKRRKKLSQPYRIADAINGPKNFQIFPDAHEPSIPTLLRDAQPAWREIEGERDPRKRKANERKRDKAAAVLFRMYKAAKSAGTLNSLDLEVRDWCETIRKHAPAPAARAEMARTGAPEKDNERLTIAVDVYLEKEARGGKHGATEAAIKAVSGKRGCSYDAVRKIYYQKRKRPNWELELKATIAMRELDKRPAYQDAAKRLARRFEWWTNRK